MAKSLLALASQSVEDPGGCSGHVINLSSFIQGGLQD
jgi:hypothetical protein